MNNYRGTVSKERPIASLVVSSGTCDHMEYRQKQARDAIYLVSLIYIYSRENDRWDMRSIVTAAKCCPYPFDSSCFKRPRQSASSELAIQMLLLILLLLEKQS